MVRLAEGGLGETFMLDWVMSVVGWEYLTPQGIRFGIASFLALSALAPGRPSWAAAAATAECLFGAGKLRRLGGILADQAKQLGDWINRRASPSRAAAMLPLGLLTSFTSR